MAGSGPRLEQCGYREKRTLCEGGLLMDVGGMTESRMIVCKLGKLKYS